MSERDNSKHSGGNQDGVLVPQAQDAPKGFLATKAGDRFLRGFTPPWRRSERIPSITLSPIVQPGLHEQIIQPESVERGESERTLTDSQRKIADITFSLRLFDTLASDVSPRLPWLQTQQRVSNSDGETLTPDELKVKDLRGMVEAYKAVTSEDPEDRRKFELNYADKGYYHTLEGRVQDLLPHIEEEKEKIFAKAATWQPKDEREALKEAHKFAVKIPKEQKKLLQEQSGITSELVNSKLKKWGITLGAFAGSSALIDEIAFLAGTATVATNNVFADHAIDNLNATEITALVAGTYLLWFGGMRKNIRSNWELLQQEGWSTNAPSKALHDWSQSEGHTENWQKRLTSAGYVATEAAKEIPWWVGAGLAEYTDFLTSKESLLFVAGANLGATMYEYGASYATDAYLRYRDKKIIRRNQPKHRRS